MNGTELKSFSHFQILTKILNLNSLKFKFVFIHCITVKVNQNDQIQL